MKIYCILFDTVPRHPKIKNILEKKDIHFSDHITCSSTVPTLITMFSGNTPTEMFGIGGIGHSHTYSKLLSKDRAVKWDDKMIFHMLPDDWKIHIHAMPETRGDTIVEEVENKKIKGGFTRIHRTVGFHRPLMDEAFKLMPDDICGRTENMVYYGYNEGEDESNFIKSMQELPSDQNHFIFLKYNHYHDASAGKTVNYNGKQVILEHELVVDMFVDMIDKIDFNETDSLFWIFADHGIPPNINKLMPPPDSWLAWCGVKDNITNNKITKEVIGCDDFKNTVLNRIYNKNLPNDILDDLDMDRIYVREDGRGNINPNYGTSVSAIKLLDKNRYTQYVAHSPQAPERTFDRFEERKIVYNKSKNEIETSTEEAVSENDKLKHHLLDGPWEWFFRKTADE